MQEKIVTPEQIALVRQSFTLLQPRMDEFGRVFYARLFTAKPELRDMFAKDMVRQSRALTGMIELIVKMLDRHEKLVPLIHYLGDRHRAASVKAEHYAPFGEALVSSLEGMLQDEFTPEMRRAWQAAYAFMADNMN